MKRPIYIGEGLIPQVERHLMFEAVNTWNEKHPNQLLVLNRYENIFILCLYNKKEDETHEKEFSVSGDSFRKAWDAFIEVTE